MNINEFLTRNLPFVQKPARYVGGEWNSVEKDGRDLLRVALIFPDLYEIGMSNYGLEIIYHVLNSQDFVWAERAYMPWIDMIAKMKENSIPLFTLESRTPVKRMDMIGISVEYELSYTNIVKILELSEVPIKSEDRSDEDPMVIGGGPLGGYIEPISEVFDAVLLGDGEEAVVEIAKVLYSTRGMNRYDRLKELSKIDGVYVPIF